MDDIINIISIDVGIKNLACCILSIDRENKNNIYRILKWDVLNLCNKENIYRKCSSDKCLRKVFYKDINEKYYCNIHSKQSGYLLPCKENTIQFFKKNKIDYLINYCNTNNINIKNIKKKIDILEQINNYINNMTLIKIEKDEANKITLVDVGKNIVHQLNSFIEDIDINIVLIENQISPIANRMKTIQGMIAQYFIMNNIEEIQFINASNKLKLFTEKGEKTTYKERKNRSINITKDILTKIYINNPQSDIINIFNNHKKKDDLADCFLQARWFINTL